MSEKKRLVIMPQYMKYFNCIGPECEENCCFGWRVDIDYDTYKKYRNLKDAGMAEKLEKHVTRNRTVSKSDNTYAKIRMKNDGSCPFLCEGLCSLQQKFGAEYLSDVCMIFPRMTNIVNSVLERSLTLSCIEAARLVLLNKEYMEFDEAEEELDIKNIIGGVLKTNDSRMANKPEKYFWELRIFTITALQDRRYLIWERLVLLGLFYQKLQECVEAGQIENIPELIGLYTGHIEQGSFREELANIPVKLGIQMEMIKAMLDKRFCGGVYNKAYRDCFGEFLMGLGYKEEYVEEEVAESYNSAFKAYYEPFMKENENIFENYLVNYVFKNLFPFTGSKSLFDAYMKMILHYSMIKLQLVGISANRKGLDESIVVKEISAFARVVEHSPTFFNMIEEIMQKNNFNTIAYMAILLKN